MLSELKEVKHQIVDNKVRAPVCFKKTNYVCVPGGKKCSFLGKFDVFCFLETPVLRFTLLPYYQQNNKEKNLDQHAPGNYVFTTLTSVLSYKIFFDSTTFS